MKISCPACAAKYSIADEKVQDRLAKIRCRKCETNIVIDGKVSPPSVYAADGPAAAGDAGAPADSAYSVDFGDSDQRSMTLSDLVDAYNSGQVTAETYVWKEGFTDWQPLGEVAEIVEALHTAASTEEAAPASTGFAVDSGYTAAAAAPAEPAPSPWDAGAAAKPAARAAVSRGRDGAADLFGGIHAAGSEEEVATSAPHQESGASAPATGARNESSVLFSLSALTQASKPSSSGSASSGLSGLSGLASSSAASSRDDSGLIDLKALTAAAESKPADQAPAIAPLGSPLGLGAPLGLGSPLGGGTAAPASVDLSPVAYPGAQKSRTGLYIAVGLVGAAVVIAGAFILRPAEPPPAPVEPPVAAAPTPAPEAEDKDEAEEEAKPIAAKPPATGNAEEEEAPDAGAAQAAAPKRTYRKTSTSSAKSSTSTGSAAKSTGASEAPKPPPKKRSPCGCAPGDLQCAMACAAK